jgi:protein-S-isoprenylcysteine O-methyltransferase Ste14
MAAFSPLHFPLDSWGQFGCQCAGWLLFLAGATMRWWATLYLGGRKSKELITEGPYSVSRNPIYIGTFALTLAIGVLSQSVAFSLAVLVVSAVYVILTVSLEESELRAEHGEQFQAYCERVPRFIPKPDLYHSPGTISVRASGLWAEFIRACRWASIPIACDLIAHLRAEPWWPAWFALP